MNEPVPQPPSAQKSLMASAKILYLDQNKWIELAQGQKSPTDYPAQREVLAFLVEESNAGRLTVPLTATNLYETHKINIKERRDHLAWVQSTLSQGMVFRGRYKRLEVEVIDHLRSGSGLEPCHANLAGFFRTSSSNARLRSGIHASPSHRRASLTSYAAIRPGSCLNT